MSTIMSKLMDAVVEDKKPLKRYYFNYKEARVRDVKPLETPQLFDYITEREMEVLKLIVKENKVIAERLQISIKTVEKHAEALRYKFNVTDKPRLLVKALRCGLIKLSEIEL